MESEIILPMVAHYTCYIVVMSKKSCVILSRESAMRLTEAHRPKAKTMEAEAIITSNPRETRNFGSSKESPSVDAMESVKDRCKGVEEMP
jgi:hypothetical protein